MISKKSSSGNLSVAAFALSTILVLGAAPLSAAENDYKQAILEQAAPQVRAFLADSRVINAVNAQNSRHDGMSQARIDKLDKQWRAETANGSGPLIESTLENRLSAYLITVQEASQGLFSEIFIMDAKGLNVGQSGLTTDYWQGDEAKWQKTYGEGADAMLIDDVEFDESSQTFQSQFSLPVIDPADGAVIGAVTVGINMDLLQ